MSVEILKKNITRILNQRNWTLPELEKKAGTNRNIYEIMRGKNTNPSAQLIFQVAHGLNVDYKELLDENNDQDYIKDYNLFSEACSLVIEELKSLPKDLRISYSASVSLVQEVRSYVEQSNNKNVDINFIKWIVNKYYSSNFK